MLRLSPGIINSSMYLLSVLRQVKMPLKITQITQEVSFPEIQAIDLLDTLVSCKWLNKDKDVIIVSEHAINIFDKYSGIVSVPFLREILKDYIIYCQPVWGSRIPYGRKEAFLIMTTDEKRCFIDAETMDAPASIEVIKWWDCVSNHIRSQRQEKNVETGRLGELLSLNYEEQRTKGSPTLQSIESNVSGYDILSQVSAQDKTPLLIEVKTSEKNIPFAKFILSKNEWNTARYSNNYLFYLWSLYGGQKKLAKISVCELSQHVPQNSGNGEWESVEIPFLPFMNLFYNEDFTVKIRIS